MHWGALTPTTVNDLTGTGVTKVNIHLAAIGGTGDAQPDTVIVDGNQRRRRNPGCWEWRAASQWPACRPW